MSTEISLIPDISDVRHRSL